jgi:hypothetical protein
MMRAALDSKAAGERAMRAQILAALEECCQGLTLRDVREWYVDSLAEGGPSSGTPAPSCPLD